MLFNSFVFILGFLPVVLAGFLILRTTRKNNLWIFWLTGASLFFYAWWDFAYLPLLLASILFNYSVSLPLRSAHRTSTHPRLRLAILVLGIGANIGLLGYFKYANFFVDTAHSAGAERFQLEEIILPLGISFFTLQQIAFLVDSYRGGTPRYSILRYAFFVSFFPQLIAGPIVHHAEVMPQLAKVVYRRIGYDVAVGIAIFVVGLAKKVVIADRLATYATPVFDAAAQGAEPTLVEAWVAATAYGFQIFFDFSGYSDMAIGVARMFGVRLPVNFMQPYKATSLIEFWRQWHITLSRFLRDYVYIPLGGSRHSSARRYAAIMVTMVVGGIWHGAGWTFIAWGTLHGLLLVGNHAWRYFMRQSGFAYPRWWFPSASRMFTLGLVMVLWVFFRSTSMDGAVNILKGMFGFSGISLPARLESVLPGVVGRWASFDGFGQLDSRTLFEGALLILVLTGIVWFLPSTHEWMARARLIPDQVRVRTWWQWRPTPVWAVLIAALGLGTIFLMFSSVSEFLYFQF